MEESRGSRNRRLVAVAVGGYFRQNLRMRGDLLDPALICVHGADVPASEEGRAKVRSAVFYDGDLAE